MSTLEDALARVRQFNAGLHGQEPVADEELVLRDQPDLEALPSADAELALESIVLRKKRPVLAIRENAAQLEFDDPEEATLWRGPLAEASEPITAACRAVGRIDLTGHQDYEWIGTGWLVDPDVMVTNRHVADAFAGGDPLTFSMGPHGRISASPLKLMPTQRPTRSARGSSNRRPRSRPTARRSSPGFAKPAGTSK